MAVNLMPQPLEGHAGHFLQYFARRFNGGSVNPREVSQGATNRTLRVCTALTVLIETNIARSLAALFQRRHIIIASISPKLCSRSRCLFGRIPIASTIGGLSLSTNGGLNPYYWVLSRVGFILVARREKPRLSLVPGSFAKS